MGLTKKASSYILISIYQLLLFITFFFKQNSNSSGKEEHALLLGCNALIIFH